MFIGLRDMKTQNFFLACCVVMLSACQHTPMNLASRPGWRFERLNLGKFRIFVSVPKATADDEGFAVAADLALTNGYRSFAVVPDPDFKDSGTHVEQTYSYDGRPGMRIRGIGSSFLIDCDPQVSGLSGRFDAPTELAHFRRKRDSNEASALR